jgi:hypothetical protein
MRIGGGTTSGSLSRIRFFRKTFHWKVGTQSRWRKARNGESNCLDRKGCELLGERLGESLGELAKKKTLTM